MAKKKTEEVTKEVTKEVTEATVETVTLKTLEVFNDYELGAPRAVGDVFEVTASRLAELQAGLEEFGGFDMYLKIIEGTTE